MVTVAEASNIVQSNLFHAQVETISLLQAVDRVLAEPVFADRDFPPFNRVAMDGIAIAIEAFLLGERSFPIESVQAAGMPQQTLKHTNHCIEVMTGAILPAGTNTVVRYEDLNIKDGVARVETDKVEVNQHVHLQGIDAKQGVVLLEPRQMLSPAEIALLAAVGKHLVNVFTKPKVAVISSGDELVPVETTPQAHQIRRSNTYALAASLQQLGCEHKQFHLPDDKLQIQHHVKDILMKYDVLILSGGVSKGKFDFIPEALEAVGVKKLFHQVNQRPGKPFWFGVTDAGKVVFALPGNPVSTYMCFYRYIQPWFAASLKQQVSAQRVVLATDFSFQPSLTYFLQVEVKNENGNLKAYPIQGGGSGDFANLKRVDGFLELPADRSLFKAGEVFEYYGFRG